MNENHARVCAGPEWAAYVQTELLPHLVGPIDLGRELLELGPGPGATTDWLRTRVERLVALELEEPAAGLLATRFAGTNVEPVVGDATAMKFPDESFDSVGCFTMLHHIPTAEGQRNLFAEALRVLRPGGVLVGADSRHTEELDEFHEGDVYNPIEPGQLLTWLLAVGFQDITVKVSYQLTFTGHKAAVPATAS